MSCFLPAPLRLLLGTQTAPQEEGEGEEEGEEEEKQEEEPLVATPRRPISRRGS